MGKDLPTKDYVQAVEFPTELHYRPIGVVRSPHSERYGTPRQAAVSADAARRPEQTARIELLTDVVSADALRDLEGFDYIWVVSHMHLNRGWNALVAPPRAPGRKRGLLATRAPHRPNPIALSAARLLSVRGAVIEVARLDLLDGTPVLDIKPYVPYADAFPDAQAGWVDELRDDPEDG